MSANHHTLSAAQLSIQRTLFVSLHSYGGVSFTQINSTCSIFLQEDQKTFLGNFFESENVTALMEYSQIKL